eukprot:SAG22_NODE_807_length_7081_cov_2.460756_4_plen_63_part_00
MARTYVDVPTVSAGGHTVLTLHFELRAFSRHQLQLQLIQADPPDEGAQGWRRIACTHSAVYV